MTTVTGQHKDGQFFTEFKVVFETTLGDLENPSLAFTEFTGLEERSDGTPEHRFSSVTESDDLPQEVQPLTEYRFSFTLNGLPRERCLSTKLSHKKSNHPFNNITFFFSVFLCFFIGIERGDFSY
jgi:hypothetical protein